MNGRNLLDVRMKLVAQIFVSIQVSFLLLSRASHVHIALRLENIRVYIICPHSTYIMFGSNSVSKTYTYS